MSEEKKHDTSPAMDSAAHMVCGAGNDERLRKQLDFILEIDKEKNILRQTHLSGHGRREDDAEHAWHMAVAAYLLQEYSNERVDIGHVLIMCLIHDIVEIDAGDTYAYDKEGLATQKDREARAEERIFSMLPPDQAKQMKALFDEFEAWETPESKFAHAMGEHGVNEWQVRGRQSKTRLGSETLFELTDGIIAEHVRRGDIKPGHAS